MDHAPKTAAESTARAPAAEPGPRSAADRRFDLTPQGERRRELVQLASSGPRAALGRTLTGGPAPRPVLQRAFDEQQMQILEQFLRKHADRVFTVPNAIPAGLQQVGGLVAGARTVVRTVAGAIRAQAALADHRHAWTILGWVFRHGVTPPAVAPAAAAAAAAAPAAAAAEAPPPARAALAMLEASINMPDDREAAALDLLESNLLVAPAPAPAPAPPPAAAAAAAPAAAGGDAVIPAGPAALPGGAGPVAGPAGAAIRSRTPYQDRLVALSAANRERLERDVGLLRDALRETHAEDLRLIDRFLEMLRPLYAHAMVAHATRHDIGYRINSTRNRQRLAAFAREATADRDRPEQVTNTTDVNTNEFNSHEFLFMNIYPQLPPRSPLRAALLRSSRFLRERYADERSPISNTAHNHVFDLHHLAHQRHNLLVAALRDPVYPGGGTTDEQHRARINRTIGGAQFFEYASRPGAGAVNYRMGTGDRRQNIAYRTRENLFVGSDITPALVANIELGLLRLFVFSADADHPRVRALITAAVGAEGGQPPDPDSREVEDRRVALVNIIKLFQYPQLMVSGGLPVNEGDKLPMGR